jgi:hypothetical protein
VLQQCIHSPHNCVSARSPADHALAYIQGDYSCLCVVRARSPAERDLIHFAFSAGRGSSRYLSMDPDLEKALAKRLEKVKVQEQVSQESGSSQNVVNETLAGTSHTPTRLPSNAGQFAKFGTKAFPGQREVVHLFPLFLIL